MEKLESNLPRFSMHFGGLLYLLGDAERRKVW
jgi:hypothetical protein